VVVVKSLYFTFLIHREQFAYQVHALRIIYYKIRLFGNFGWVNALLSCQVWRLWLPKVIKIIKIR